MSDNPEKMVRDQEPISDRRQSIEEDVLTLNLQNSIGAAPPDNDNSTKEATPEKPWTVYGITEKTMLVLIVSWAGFFSSVSSPIYLPAITELSKEFNVSTELMNLTVTMYSIFQGIGPALWCPVADSIGRRPVYICCFVVYIGSCIGLALTRWYWLLFGLRCAQSFGIATTIALGSGVVSDVTTRKERGKYIGIFTGVSLVGNAFGPLIGGGLASGLGWRSIFWFLVIASGVSLVGLIFLYPETNRFIAGDGSVMPKNWWNKSLYALVRRKVKGVPNIRAEDAGLKPHPLKVLTSVKMLRYADVSLALTPGAMHYTAWFMMITAQSSLLASQYNFDSGQIGLSYLASGIGALVGSIGSGRIMNWYYRKCMRELESARTADGEAQQPEVEVDVYRARLGLSLIPSASVILACIVFGWTIECNVHYVVPLIFTAFASVGAMTLQNFIQTLLVDLFPKDSASSTAAANLTRCLLCAVGLAVVDRMIQSLGVGGAMTLVAGLCFLSAIPLVIVQRVGPRLEQKRLRQQTSA